FATYVDRGVVSMSGAYAMLVDRSNGGLSLRRMIGETLKQLHITYGKPRMAVEYNGPDVELGQRQVMPLSLTIAELYSNCVRHGAGASLTGKLTVQWYVDESEDGSGSLRIEWIESDGPSLEGLIVPGMGIELVQ